MNYDLLWILYFLGAGLATYYVFKTDIIYIVLKIRTRSKRKNVIHISPKMYIVFMLTILKYRHKESLV